MHTPSEKRDDKTKPKKPICVLKTEDWIFERHGEKDMLRSEQHAVLIPIQEIIKRILAAHSDDVSYSFELKGEEYRFLASRGKGIESDGKFVPMQDKGRAYYFKMTCNKLPELNLFIVTDMQKARSIQVTGLGKHGYLVMNNGADASNNLDAANAPLTLGKAFNPASETRSGQTVHTSLFLTDAQREKLKEKAPDVKEKRRTGLNM